MNQEAYFIGLISALKLFKKEPKIRTRGKTLRLSIAPKEQGLEFALKNGLISRDLEQTAFSQGQNGWNSRHLLILSNPFLSSFAFVR